MKQIRIKNFYQDDTGGSAVEYSILLACIAIAIISAINILGNSVVKLFVKGGEIFNNQ